MTNKDKFLRESVSVKEFAEELALSIILSIPIKDKTVGTISDKVISFLNKPIIPTLTEDERVILRNINTNYYPTIKKTGRTLYIVSKEDTYKEIEYMFKDHLFQFIKEGEECEIEKLLGDDE